MSDENNDDLITPDEVTPKPEGEEAPVSDYPEVEDEIRSEEDTKAMENRAPVVPSPGASVDIVVEEEAKSKSTKKK